MKTITITCETRDTLPFEALEVFQGALKKRTDEDYRKIRESIEKHGFAAPFFVWRDNGHNWLIDGTGRYETLERMRGEGYVLPALPVVYVLAGSEAEARELLLKITSHYGKVSAKGLEAFLKGLEVDFSGLDLGVFLKPKDLPETWGVVPETAPETVTRAGDLYELCDAEGNARHRLACGDAAREETFAALMGNEKAALVFTDPPYGVNYGEKQRDIKEAAHKTNTAREAAGLGHEVRNDDLNGDALRLLLARAFRNTRSYMREDAAFYVCFGSFPHLTQIFLDAMDEAGLKPRHQIIWVKNQATFSMNRLDYDYQHENIWYGWNEKHRFYGQGKFKSTVWNFNKLQKSDLHPTQKPPELVEEAIKNSLEPPGIQSVEKSVNGIINNTGKGDIVLDPFAGSGSVLAACEHLKRRAYLIELEGRYCDVIVKRWLEMKAGNTAVRVRDGKRETWPEGGKGGFDD